MQKVKSLDDLNLPAKFHSFLAIFLYNISDKDCQRSYSIWKLRPGGCKTDE